VTREPELPTTGLRTAARAVTVGGGRLLLIPGSLTAREPQRSPGHAESLQDITPRCVDTDIDRERPVVDHVLRIHDTRLDDI